MDRPDADRFVCPAVDLSEQALAVARENIAAATGNTCETTLTTSDLLAFVEAESGSPDIMLVSFSLHHLPKEAKVNECAKLSRVSLGD